MEVGDPVLTVEHADHYAEEHRNDRHDPDPTPFSPPASLTTWALSCRRSVVRLLLPRVWRSLDGGARRHLASLASRVRQASQVVRAALARRGLRSRLECREEALRALR